MTEKSDEDYSQLKKENAMLKSSYVGLTSKTDGIVMRLKSQIGSMAEQIALLGYELDELKKKEINKK